jgi:hypothetical protein
MSDSTGLAYFTVIPNSGTEWPLNEFDDTGHSSGAPRSSAEARLSISDADPPANSNPDRPRVLRSRFTVRVGAHSSFFHLDKSLTSVFRVGDTIHIACTARGGVGVAVLRDRQLVVAVGAVSSVPSGGDVSVRVAPELWEQAVSLAEPDGATEDPRQTYRDERPVAIGIAGKTYLFFRRNETIQGIHVFVKHGFYTHSPNATRQPSVSTSIGEATGKDECVALARISLCSRVSATTSAYLLAADGLAADP